MQFFSESLCILWGSGEPVLLIVVGVTLNNGSNLYSLEANSWVWRKMMQMAAMCSSDSLTEEIPGSKIFMLDVLRWL